MAAFEARNGKLCIDGKEVLRGWEAWTGWYWFATEIARTQDSILNGKVYENDTIYFGVVQGHVEAWGSFSDAELSSLKPRVWEIPTRNLPYSGRREAKPRSNERSAQCGVGCSKRPRVLLYPLRKTRLENLQGFIQRLIVIIAFPDEATFVQCLENYTMVIRPDLNPAVRCHPAADRRIRLLPWEDMLLHAPPPMPSSAC